MIEFAEVRAGYGDRDVLEGFDLRVGPGELVALTGPSGSGKSTAVALALGFRAPRSGRVLVEGRVAWVPQTPALLAGTIESNIRLGAPGAPTSRVRRILDQAGGTDLDLDRPAVAGTEGLSAGEIRRVALARALLRIDCGGGDVLIMDEPTAGLDADTELAAIATVKALGVTTLVVSHRPAVLAAADRVVEMERVSA